MGVNTVSRGRHCLIPYLIVDDAARALDFYATVFGGEEIMRMRAGPRIVHAEVRIGDARVMLAEEHPELGYFGPKARGGPSVSMMVYVPDPDAAFARALELGAIPERPVQDQFYGDRSGTLIDPFGHRWTISTRIEDLSPDELQARMEKLVELPEKELAEA